MNIVDFFKKGKIKGIYLGMSIKDFKKKKIYNKITDKISAFDDEYGFIFYISIGIEIGFFFQEVNSTSIDPSYDNFKINKLEISRKTSLEEILKFYYRNTIEWAFKFREKRNECEVVTLDHNISIIFTFDKNDFWMSKIYLSHKKISSQRM